MKMDRREQEHRLQLVAQMSDEEIKARGAVARLILPNGSLHLRLVVDVDFDIEKMTNEAVRGLSRDLRVYQRGGSLVEVVRVPKTEADTLTLEGAPSIRIMPKAILLERLATATGWVQVDDEGQVREMRVPKEIVSAVHERGQWKGIRPLVSIVEAPSMRPDGSIIQDAGKYDASTGVLYLPNAVFPPIPTEPTQDDARAALAELSDAFVDFPYAKPEHASVGIAMLLSMLARPAITGAMPAFVFDASTRGSGKSLHSDAIATIATGRGTGKMSWPEDEAELEKQLAACALQGASLVNFDNITRVFGGGPLDKVLTARDTVQFRILGRSESPTLPWRGIICGTGNNVEFATDTARRVLVCRLEPSDERPEERTGFRHNPLLPWLEANRPRLVVAALTILRAWVVAGRPSGGCATWGSFEEWAALIPPAIVFAGGVNALDARGATATSGDDAETAALRTILEFWPRMSAGNPVSLKYALEVLYPQTREPGPPDGLDDLREALEGLVPIRNGRTPDVKSLGYKLRRFKSRVLGGRRLEGATDRKGVLMWSVGAI